jgi:hypothetical protein
MNAARAGQLATGRASTQQAVLWHACPLSLQRKIHVAAPCRYRFRALPSGRPEHASRLINHGPTVLISSAHGAHRNIMAAAWSMPVEFTPRASPW